jgi:hypothetical protein
MAWSPDKKYKKIINEYSAVHRDLLSEGNQIFSETGFASKLTSKEGVIEILTAFFKFSGRVCDHARHENQHIVPLIENNQTLRFLSSRNLRVYHAAFKSEIKNKSLV